MSSQIYLQCAAFMLYDEHQSDSNVKTVIILDYCVPPCLYRNYLHPPIVIINNKQNDYANLCCKV